MDQHSPFVPLLLITLLAVLVPILTSQSRLIRLPIVVGEILAGIIIGESGFDLVHPSPTLSFLAEFGFTFLMFLSGLEVNLELLFNTAPGANDRPRWQRPIPLASIWFLLSVFMAVAISFGLTSFGLARSAILMGLILSTTSLGIVVPMLKERGLTTTTYGQVVLFSALLSDFVTLLLLSVTIAVFSQGLSLDLLLFMALLAAFISAAKISPWLTQMPFLTRVVEELSHATAQIRVRGAFALMVIWVVLAEAFGVEVILGAFLAGVIVSTSSPGHGSPLREKLDAIGYGFFIPIFFISVGAAFDLSALLASPAALLLVPILIVAAYLVKILPALLFRTVFSWRETLAAGALLSSRLSMIIAASAIALELGMITPAVNSAVILVAIVTCTFSPLLFARLLPSAEPVQRDGIVILGTDQLAVLLGQRLRQTGERVTFIGHDQKQLGYLRERGFRSICEDPADEQVLEQAGLSHARALVAVSHATESILPVCRLAQERFKVPLVIARADDPQLALDLQALNVQVIQPALAVAQALEGALHFPAAFAMLMGQNDDVGMIDVPLRNSALAGRPLRHIRFPGDALAVGVQRNGEVVIPHGDTSLQQGDVLILVGSIDSLRETRRQFC
jgi:Kef-type K+ transport system membrane component KefB/Trk K+ transport system NAD-binding subunit